MIQQDFRPRYRKSPRVDRRKSPLVPLESLDPCLFALSLVRRLGSIFADGLQVGLMSLTKWTSV